MLWKFTRHFLSFKDVFRSVGFKWSKARLCRSHLSPHEGEDSHLSGYFAVSPCLPKTPARWLWFHLGHVWIMLPMPGSSKDLAVIPNAYRSCFPQFLDATCYEEVLPQACRNLLPPCKSFLWAERHPSFTLLRVSFVPAAWLRFTRLPPLCHRLGEPRVQTQSQ